MIKNFLPERIASCSYDFRLGKIYSQKKQSKPIEWRKKKPEMKKLKFPYILKPGEFILAQTKEEIEMPLDLVGFCCPRGVAYRLGLTLLASITTSGYKGTLTFGIKNDSSNQIIIYEDLELLQIVFFDLKGDPMTFNERFLGGKLL
jgi:deoxycytidine triphosphate deaminase